MLVGHNDMINVARDEVFTETMKTILKYYSSLNERLEVIDHTFDAELDSVLKSIKDEVNMARKNIIRSIKWNLAGIHDDHGLIDELIEEQNAEGEMTLDNFLRGLE